MVGVGADIFDMYPQPPTPTGGGGVHARTLRQMPGTYKEFIEFQHWWVSNFKANWVICKQLLEIQYFGLCR